jgi:CHAT domain-containing protein/tetratricopeptide (TPR) repeat protein
MRLVLSLLLLCSAGAGGASAFHPTQGEDPSAPVEDATLLIEEAQALQAEGHVSRARQLLQRADAVLNSRGDSDAHEGLWESRWEIGNLALKVGAHALARASFEAVLRHHEEHLDEDDERIFRVRVNLSAACLFSGELERALALDREILAQLLRVFPEEHFEVQRARLNLSAPLLELGETEEARSLLERAIAVLERTVAADDIDLQRARMNLGVAFARQGRHLHAAGLFTRILEVQERTLEPQHPDLQRTRLNLAAMLRSGGDYSASYALHRKVLDGYEETASEDDPGLLMARINFGVLCLLLGDLEGAETLLRQVVAGEGRVLPRGHPTLLLARENLAIVLMSAGELEEAQALQRDLLAQLEDRLPPDHPRLLTAQASQSSLLEATGDHEGAQAIRARLLQQWSSAYPPENPFLLSLKANMALAARARGEAQRARELTEELAATCEASFPPDSPYRRRAYFHLACVLAGSGSPDAVERLESLMGSALSAERSWVAGLVALPPRLAAETATQGSSAMSCWLTLDDQLAGAPGQHAGEFFALIEEIRAVTSGALHSTTRGQLDPELEKLRERAQVQRERVNALAASLGSPREDERSSAQEIAEAVLLRDRAVAGLRSALVEQGLSSPSIDARALGAALPEGSAAVGFRSFTRTLEAGGEVPWLTAFVLRSGGALTRVDLGPLAPIAAASRDWRAAIGKVSGRGVSLAGVSTTAATSELEAGSLLRALCLDPVLEAVGEALTLHVCVDDVLHLLPLDALPLGEGVVGDRYAIRNEVSFARLLLRRDWIPGEPTLFAIGDVDFDAAVVADPSLAPRAAPPVNLTRGGLPAGFGPLLGTRAEVKKLGETFEERFEVEASLLFGRDATRTALYEHAPQARFLHLATHGYFASEGVSSWADVVSSRTDWVQEESDRVVRGMAPLTLCGLALAGANTAMDSTGRVPGILTGEELAGLDLWQCELAVLSACETNVGDRRPGQGIHSLQSALHSAGVRTAVTSLWKVDDEWTRRLMEEFYRRMWLERQGKARALWDAKCALRAAGALLRDWAPWVLTGDPE